MPRQEPGHVRVSIESLWNGISEQPPHLRAVNQVQSAENVIFNVRDGASKRPGTFIERSVGGNVISETYGARMHKILRSPDEQYIVVHGDGCFEVYEIGWYEADVTISASAQTYLDYGTARGSISGNTVASPTVVTTTANHGLRTGDLVTIYGSTSTPSIDGTRSVTVTGATTFTVAVNVTVLGGACEYELSSPAMSTARDRYRLITMADTTFVVNIHKQTADIEYSDTISGNTLANPTVVTTSGNHGLTSGDTVVITGSNSTPSINGTHVVTVISPTTFSIPVNVTGAGTAGTVTSGRLDATTMPHAMTRTARSIRTTQTITANSAANPTVVTTAKPHGLTSGQSVDITGSNSTPVIDGKRTVTVTGASTFTVPVDCSGGAGTAGTFTARALFNLDAITWDQRQSGDSSSNPAPRLIRDSGRIADIAILRNRLVIAGGDRLEMGQTGDHYNFWITDATNIVDSDPISVQVGAGQSADVTYLVPIRRALLVFTAGGQQFEVSGYDTGLTQTTVRSTPITSYLTVPIRPEVADPRVYFLTRSSGACQLYEYLYDEVELPNQASHVSSHCPTLVALVDGSGNLAQPLAMGCSPANNMAFILTSTFDAEGDSIVGVDMYTYASAWIGGRKVQSAWGQHVWGASDPSDFFEIWDICVVNDFVYMLTSTRMTHLSAPDDPRRFYLERWPMTTDAAWTDTVGTVRTA